MAPPDGGCLSSTTASANDPSVARAVDRDVVDAWLLAVDVIFTVAISPPYLDIAGDIAVSFIGRRARAAALAVVLAAVPGGAALAQSASPGVVIPTCTSLATPPVVSVPSPAPAASLAAASGELTVFAAASLKSAFESFAPAYQAETGLGLTSSFDASSALRAQIEQGAPADVFASADTANVETLVGEGLATDPVAFACNQLTIIVPAGNPAGITAATDLGKPGVKVIAAGDEVPISKYARQLVGNLGIADAYAANVVSREDNVAAVRSKIELGEGDAGIVYVTDALASGDKVEQVDVPADANVPATYAAAVVTATDQADASAAFVDWLAGPEGRASLAAFGLLPAPVGGPEASPAS
jgi:molybdate transport system substrate-binding protein